MRRTSSYLQTRKTLTKKIERQTSTRCHKFEYLTLLNTSPDATTRDQQGIDEYKIVKPYGLTCAMLGRVSIPDGLNRKEFHAGIEKELRKNIEFAAEEKIPNVICMAGNRRGMADDEGIKQICECWVIAISASPGDETDALYRKLNADVFIDKMLLGEQLIPAILELTACGRKVR